jgi:hypothetical protein
MHSKADHGLGVLSEILLLQWGNRAVRIMIAIEQGRRPTATNSCSFASQWITWWRAPVTAPK